MCCSFFCCCLMSLCLNLLPHPPQNRRAGRSGTARRPPKPADPAFAAAASQPYPGALGCVTDALFVCAATTAIRSDLAWRSSPSRAQWQVPPLTAEPHDKADETRCLSSSSPSRTLLSRTHTHDHPTKKNYTKHHQHSHSLMSFHSHPTFISSAHRFLPTSPLTQRKSRQPRLHPMKPFLAIDIVQKLQGHCQRFVSLETWLTSQPIASAYIHPLSPFTNASSFFISWCARTCSLLSRCWESCGSGCESHAHVQPTSGDREPQKY